MSVSARRCCVPVAVSNMGGPPDTITDGPPAHPISLPLGVSKQVSAADVYQASGPEWV